jgi:hypothetical protein
MTVEVLGRISGVETIAIGRRIGELDRLLEAYGPGRWSKRKGIAKVNLPDGSVRRGEIRWYEAIGIGRREFKIKRLLDTE